MEKKTNYGKIIAITIAVIAAFTAIAFVIYKLFVKDLATCYCCEDGCDEEFLEEADSDECECECVETEAPVEEAEA